MKNESGQALLESTLITILALTCFLICLFSISILTIRSVANYWAYSTALCYLEESDQRDCNSKLIDQLGVIPGFQLVDLQGTSHIQQSSLSLSFKSLGDFMFTIKKDISL